VKETFSIGELAHPTGTKVETIRYYERIGLLPAPARTGGNYRAYTRQHLARLNFIRRARDLGLSLDQVRQLLHLADDSDQPCIEVGRIARQHLVDVERRLAHLSALATELRRLIAECSRGAVAECRVIKALAAASP